MTNRVELRDEFLSRLTKLGKPIVTRNEVKEICKSVG